VLLAVGKTVWFIITFYCACSTVCTRGLGVTAAGVRPVEGWTVACDPSVLPIGSIVRIEGLGERMCQDTGSAIRGRHVDVYVDDHAQARRLGKKRLQLEILHVPAGE